MGSHTAARRFRISVHGSVFESNALGTPTLLIGVSPEDAMRIERQQRCIARDTWIPSGAFRRGTGVAPGGSTTTAQTATVFAT
jgi:hypothetical protein